MKMGEGKKSKKKTCEQVSHGITKYWHELCYKNNLTKKIKTVLAQNVNNFKGKFIPKDI